MHLSNSRKALSLAEQEFERLTCLGLVSRSDVLRREVCGGEREFVCQRIASLTVARTGLEDRSICTHRSYVFTETVYILLADTAGKWWPMNKFASTAGEPIRWSNHRKSIQLTRTLAAILRYFRHFACGNWRCSFLLHLLRLPDDIITPLALASGGLVPAIALRLRDRRKTRIDQLTELLTRSFARPPVYIVIISSAMLLLTQLAAYFLVGIVVGGALASGIASGSLSSEESRRILDSLVSRIWTEVLSVLAVATVAIPVGKYLAHRLAKRQYWWAILAVVLSQLGSLIIDLVFAATSDSSLQFRLYVIYFTASTVTVSIGVSRGRKTRALFLAGRLFRGLSEADRAAVLDLMDKAGVRQQLTRDQEEPLEQ